MRKNILILSIFIFSVTWLLGDEEKFNFQEGEIFILEWKSTGVQKITGSPLPMDFNHTKFRNYSLRVLEVNSDRVLFEIYLIRQWGNGGDSITGSYEFDSDLNESPEDSRIQLSEYLGIPFQLELIIQEMKIEYIDKSSPSAVEAFPYIQFLFNGGKVFFEDLETISGSMEISCEPEDEIISKGNIQNKCSTGKVVEKQSQSEGRQGILNILAQSVGPPVLKTASAMGIWNYLQESKEPANGKVNIDIQYTFGKGKNSKINWKYLGETSFVLVKN